MALRTARSFGFATFASLAALAAGTPALAQDETPVSTGAEEEEQSILVTATKRETSLLEVPFSINAQTEEDIQRSGANTLEDLSRNVAGLSIQNLGPGQSQVSVRGVSAGQIVRDQPGVKEQVGVYLDESPISLSLFTPDVDLFDLNRVETLRGPQGTLFGSGSIGGTIRYITNRVDMDNMEGLIEANVNLVGGDDIGGHLKGMINVPLTTGVAMRAVGYYTRYGGFVDARREGGSVDENVNDGHRVGGRLSIALEPAPGVRLTPRVVYQEIRANGFNRQEVYNLYANPFTTTRPPVQLGEREQHLLLREGFSDDTLLVDFTGEFELGETLDLTSISTYISRDIVVSRDASALTGSVSVDLGYPTAGVLLPSNLVDTTDLGTFAQEIRLSSDSDGPVNFVAGIFYSNTNRNYTQRLPTPGYDAFTDARFGAGTSVAVANGFPLNSPYNADLPYDIEQKAAFGEATIEFTDRITFTGGGRFYNFNEVRQFISGGLFSNGDERIDETSSSGFSPRFILTWEALDDVRFNAQASKGFRLGGVNDPLNITLCSASDAAIFGGFPDYEDETLWNYELGVRGQRNGISFGAAAYHTRINNLQITADAGSCSSRVVFNVEEAHTTGFEAEVSAELIDGLSFSLAASLVEAEIDSTLPGPTPGSVVAGIREGNRLPSVPNFQLSASASYNWRAMEGAEAFVGASFQHVGSRYTQAADQEGGGTRTFVHGLPFGGAPASAATTLDLRLPSYNYVNLSAGIDWDNGLGVMVYVTNLFDENALLSFDRERGGRARLGHNIGQPRVIGVTVRQRFGS